MKSARIRHASMALLLSLTGVWTGAAISQGHSHSKKQLDEDIMDHRTMAEAHRKAAECLEAGKPEKECRAQLAKDCKGVGIGRGCGMKDRHKH